MGCPKSQIPGVPTSGAGGPGSTGGATPPVSGVNFHQAPTFGSQLSEAAVYFQSRNFQILSHIMDLSISYRKSTPPHNRQLIVTNQNTAVELEAQTAEQMRYHLETKVDTRLPGKGNSNSHGARPVHHIISMMKWIRASRLSINDSLSATPPVSRVHVNFQSVMSTSRVSCQLTESDLNFQRPMSVRSGGSSRVQGDLAHKKHPPPQDHPRTLRIVLL